MKCLIVYHSKYGTTETCVLRLRDKLSGDIEIVALGKKKIDFLEDFDTIIVGGPIYMGRLEPIVADFCRDNVEILAHKKLGFFYCAMSKPEEAKAFFLKSIPESLYNSATAISYFGGEIHPEKMNFIKRFFIKKLLEKNPPAIESIQEDEIERFVRKFQ